MLRELAAPDAAEATRPRQCYAGEAQVADGDEVGRREREAQRCGGQVAKLPLDRGPAVQQRREQPLCMFARLYKRKDVK